MIAARAPPRRKPASLRRRSAWSVHESIAHDGSDENGSRRLAWHAPRLSDGELILVAGALLAAGLLASLVAARLRVPGLLLFLFIGMGIGSDGLDWIDF